MAQLVNSKPLIRADIANVRRRQDELKRLSIRLMQLWNDVVQFCADPQHDLANNM